MLGSTATLKCCGATGRDSRLAPHSKAKRWFLIASLSKCLYDEYLVNSFNLPRKLRCEEVGIDTLLTRQSPGLVHWPSCRSGFIAETSRFLRTLPEPHRDEHPGIDAVARGGHHYAGDAGVCLQAARSRAPAGHAEVDCVPHAASRSTTKATARVMCTMWFTPAGMVHQGSAEGGPAGHHRLPQLRRSRYLTITRHPGRP